MSGDHDVTPREMTDDDRYEELEPEVLVVIDARRQAAWDAMTPEAQAKAAAAFEKVPF